MQLIHVDKSNQYYYLPHGKPCLGYILEIITEILEYCLFGLDSSQIFNLGQVDGNHQQDQISSLYK